MKTNRHSKIIELIKNEIIETQEDLTRRLCECGYDVTQATVSRDIKALKLIKVATGKDNDGGSRYRYALHQTSGGQVMSEKFKNLLRDVIVNAEYACNLAVIKTYAGMANAAAAAIDTMHNESIIGSVAGDDTVLIVLRNEQKAKDFIEIIKKSIE